MGARRRRWQNSGEGGFELVHILSPFDPLIIQRKRTHLIFDYEHRFEAYVPKEKRKFGYFALPVLVGERHRRRARPQDRPSEQAIAAAEMELGRQGQEREGDARKELKRRIEEELHRFERFQLAE